MTDTSAASRQQRRREQRERRNHLHRMGREAAGAYHFEVIRASDALILDEKRLRRFLEAAAGMAHGIKMSGTTALCLNCDVEFPPAIPDAFVVITAARNDPTAMVASPVCSSCAEKSDHALVDINFARLKKHNPSLRKLPPQHFHASAGHA